MGRALVETAPARAQRPKEALRWQTIPMTDAQFATEGVETVDERRHILVGDLEWLEFAVADYVAKWCTNWTGVPYMGEFGANIAGMPTAVANAAMTVIRKNIAASFTEQVTLDAAAVDREIKSKAAGWPHRADVSLPVDGCFCRDCATALGATTEPEQ